MNNNYEDIINLEPPISKKHSKMPISARAAQFAPFSALTGYKEAIEETGRITEAEIFLDEDKKVIINEKLNTISKNLESDPKITLTYFIKDKNKQGGKIVTEIISIKKIDLITEELILTDKRKISLKNIIDIV
mgnify:CR=1 FL=1